MGPVYEVLGMGLKVETMEDVERGTPVIVGDVVDQGFPVDTGGWLVVVDFEVTAVYDRLVRLSGPIGVATLEGE